MFLDYHVYRLCTAVGQKLEHCSFAFMGLQCLTSNHF